MKKIFLAFLILGLLPSTLNAQLDNPEIKRWKITLNAGFAQNTFNKKEPFNVIQCFEGCQAIRQKALATFIFGSSFIRRVGQRNYLGVGYQNYRIKLEQQYEDFFSGGGNTFDYTYNQTIHSFSINHQFLMMPNKRYLFWNNAIGVDKFKEGLGIFKRLNLFYRTGFDLGYTWKNYGLYVNPSLQIGLKGYYFKTIKPITYGLSTKMSIQF